MLLGAGRRRARLLPGGSGRDSPVAPSLGPGEPRAGLLASGSSDNTLCRLVPRRPWQQPQARRWWRRPGQSGAAVNLPSRTLGTSGASTAWELVRNAGPRVHTSPTEAECPFNSIAGAARPSPGQQGADGQTGRTWVGTSYPSLSGPCRLQSGTLLRLPWTIRTITAQLPSVTSFGLV